MTSPLEKFKQEHTERWTVLQDIPPWEYESVILWLQLVFSNGGGTDFRGVIVQTINREFRLRLRSDLDIDATNWKSMRQSLVQLINSDQIDKFILFLDCVVHYVRDYGDHSGVFREVEFNYAYKNIDSVLQELENVLENGSKWTVVFETNSDDGLIERVDGQLTKLAKDLNNDHLTKAWNQAFAVRPDPAKAIEDAQKAVEHEASNNGLTTVKTGVFGNLLGDIRAHPDKYISAAKDAYNLSNQISNDPNSPVDFNIQFSNWFSATMDLMQKSNPGHHASIETKNFKLGQGAAKQEVLIATLLCELISKGYFKKA